jgi:hypothetical protein
VSPPYFVYSAISSTDSPSPDLLQTKAMDLRMGEKELDSLYTNDINTHVAYNIKPDIEVEPLINVKI